jgi:hypothetical protein
MFHRFVELTPLLCMWWCLPRIWSGQGFKTFFLKNVFFGYIWLTQYSGPAGYSICYSLTYDLFRAMPKKGKCTQQPPCRFLNLSQVRYHLTYWHVNKRKPNCELVKPHCSWGLFIRRTCVPWTCHFVTTHRGSSNLIFVQKFRKQSTFCVVLVALFWWI